MPSFPYSQKMVGTAGHCLVIYTPKTSKNIYLQWKNGHIRGGRFKVQPTCMTSVEHSFLYRSVHSSDHAIYSDSLLRKHEYIKTNLHFQKVLKR